MKKVVILGGNKLAFYLSCELQKENYLTFHLSRKFQKKSHLYKFVKLQNYNFQNLKKKIKDINPEIIINLISYTGNNLQECIKVNSKLPNKIIRYCNICKISLVLLGSSAEYGITKKNTLQKGRNLIQYQIMDILNHYKVTM